MYLLLITLGCSSGLKPSDVGADTAGTSSTPAVPSVSEEVCGDGLIQGDEECDGDDFGGVTCIDLGFNTGEVLCTPGCFVDDVNCSNRGDCEDSCVYAEDGACDDGGPGSTSAVCAVGTDCADCGYRLCEDSCTWKGDGACDDGGPGATGDACAYGTDCSDCGVR